MLSKGLRKNMTKILIVPKLILMLVLMLSASSLTSAYEGEGPVSFKLPGLHGKDLSLDEFRGKWLVLNYWATWCAPCRKEIPDLSALHSAHEDIVVLGLAFEDTDIESFNA